MTKNIFIIGSPAVGKTTLAKTLQQRLGFEFIDVGELVRQAFVEKPTSGNPLTPSSAIMEILKKELTKIHPSKTVLIEGFPRTMENVLNWEMEMKTPICILFLVSKTHVLNSRIREKLTSLEEKSNTALNTILFRQSIFENNCSEILNFYQQKNLISIIEANGDKNEVLNKTCNVLARVLNHNKINFSDGGILTIQKMSENASFPIKGSSFAAGYDIFSSENAVILPGQTMALNTDICVQPPPGTYVRLAERSGLSLTGVRVCGGVCDPDFTKPIKVILCNHGEKPFFVGIKMRIAQMITTHISMPAIVEGEIEPNDERGDGFGSSGNY